jgi:hypothetical protein
MTQKLKTLIINACTQHDGLQATVNDIAKEAKRISFDAYRAIVVDALSVKYGVEPHESKSTKKLTFVKDSAAEQKLSRMLKLHPSYGAGTKSHRKEVKVDKALVANIVDTVIDAGLTKAEFDALISQLRASVQFK